MEDLQVILKRNKYKKIKFKISKTHHLLIKAIINGVKGNFILDTGASNSCIALESITLFNLNTSKSKTKAAGAGGRGMKTLVSNHNTISLGSWKTEGFSLVVFDLSHVNDALLEHKAKSVHGIIGADILQSGKAIIDYYNHCFYLKTSLGLLT
ncbi:retropepsin-like aspartic protease [Flavobacterium sp.]|uniref:retropepsin-like aspartic protease n=1 Tax=Flavobacterium sp. TaxID=239 RepID=UPI00374DCEAB